MNIIVAKFVDLSLIYNKFKNSGIFFTSLNNNLRKNPINIDKMIVLISSVYF